MVKSYQLSEYVDALSSKINFSSDGLFEKINSVRKSHVNIPVGLDEKIDFNQPLKSIPKNHMKDVLNFVGYLNETAQKTFKIKGFNHETGELTEKIIPYVHRWTQIYRRGFLAKLYQLEEALGSDVSDVTMITLTVYQDGLDPEESLSLLKTSYNKLMKVMRKHFGTTDFFRMLEHHQTGYPHMHIVYCKILDKFQQNYIIDMWSKTYKAGSKAHGVNFAEVRGSDSGEFKGGAIARMRGYLMKYVSKSLFSEETHNCEFHGKQLPFRMSKGELLFNAILKKTKTRLWNASRNFSKIMKRPDKEPSPEWECTEVSQYTNEEFRGVLWSKERGLRPDIIKTWRLLYINPLVFKSDLERESLGQIKIEKSVNNGVVSYGIYEPVWVPADCV